jgi:hypothetical protein
VYHIVLNMLPMAFRHRIQERNVSIVRTLILDEMRRSYILRYLAIIKVERLTFEPRNLGPCESPHKEIPSQVRNRLSAEYYEKCVKVVVVPTGFEPVFKP